MTKKSKQEELSMTKQNEQQKINPSNHQKDNSLLSPQKQSTNKKFIKKPQPLTLIQKIDSLKEKNHKLFKHAQKKIEKMIQIIDQISQKQLGSSCLGKSDGGGGKMKQNHQSEEIQLQIPQDGTVTQSQKSTITKTLTYLHNLLTYEKPLSHIKKQFQSFYSKLSSFSKELQSQSPLSDDKKFLIPDDGLVFEQTKLVEQLIKQHYLRTGQFDVARIFDNYSKQEQNPNNNSEYNNRILGNIPNKQQLKRNKSLTRQQNLSKQKGMKHSMKKPGKSSIKKPPKVQLIDLEQNFYQCFTLRNQLLKGNFQQPIIWCQQQRLYETHSNPLQYQLRLVEIKLLIREEKFNLAYEKIEHDMARFLNNYEQQINLLVGYLLFSCQWDASKIFSNINNNTIPKQQLQQQSQLFSHSKLIKQRYSKFIIVEGQIEKLAQKFTHQYFIHYDISQFDTLEICYQVGKKYQQQYFDAIKMFSQKDKQQFLKHRLHCEYNDKNIKSPHPVILPFEIPVQKQYLYHSIFVCPVTKAVLSSNDGVEFLSCGHLVSESAKKDMAEVRRSNHKQKCPVCQKDRTTDVIKVSF